MMNTAKHNPQSNKHGFLEKKKLAKIIRDWVVKNKKLFWKYEVSCFYKTYTIRIANLPQPSVEDITVSSINRLLINQQKKQLSDAITNAALNAEVLINSCIDVQIGFEDGAVITQII
jgi:hypothetical protein